MPVMPSDFCCYKSACSKKVIHISHEGKYVIHDNIFHLEICPLMGKLPSVGQKSLYSLIIGNNSPFKCLKRV